MSQPCGNDECFEIVDAEFCEPCRIKAIYQPPAQAAEEPVAPEPTPEPQPVAKARRSPRKASAPAAEVDWKALYEIASQNIRAMCLAGAFIPGVAPNCPCPSCPKPIECAHEQIGPTSTVERRGEVMFDS